MVESGPTTRLRFWLLLFRLIGVIVPRRLRADWRQEWEAELSHREDLLAEWDRLAWRNKLDLVARSSSAFWDAIWMQTYRWEDAMIQEFDEIEDLLRGRDADHRSSLEILGRMSFRRVLCLTIYCLR